MESQTYKELASTAKANANQATSKAASAQGDLDTIAFDDPKKISLQSKVSLLRNYAASKYSEANVYTTVARTAEIKEEEKAYKEIEDEQRAIQEEKTKNQEKLEQQNKEKVAEKADLQEEKSVNSFIDGNDSTDEELSFLNQDRAPTHFAQVEEIVKNNYVGEVKDSAQVSKADNKKDSEEDQKLVKALDGAGTAGA